MSYANMIENRHLKKTFITAITVSAILSCLTSAQSINEHIKLRREEKTRKKHDEEQDKSIRKLQKDVHGGAAGAKEGAKGIKDKVKDKVKGALPGKERKPEPSYEEDFDEQIERSARSIGREYDYGYRRGGDRFAEGDCKSILISSDHVLSSSSISNCSSPSPGSGHRLAAKCHPNAPECLQ